MYSFLSIIFFYFLNIFIIPIKIAVASRTYEYFACQWFNNICIFFYLYYTQEKLLEIVYKKITINFVKNIRANLNG